MPLREGAHRGRLPRKAGRSLPRGISNSAGCDAIEDTGRFGQGTRSA
jgi:hypothetical protein